MIEGEKRVCTSTYICACVCACLRCSRIHCTLIFFRASYFTAYQERLEKDRLRKREERRKLREKAKEADRVLEIWKQNPSAMAGTMGTPHLAAISHPTQMQVS